MDRFLLGKRKASSSPPSSRAKERARSPSILVSWNANGLMARIEADQLVSFGRLVSEQSPDLIAVQEARVRAFCSNPTAKRDSREPRVRGRPAQDESVKLDKVLNRPPFDGETRPPRPFRCHLLQPRRYKNPPTSRVSAALSCPLDCAPTAGYRAFFSLANSRHAGTLLLVKRALGRPDVFSSVESAMSALRAHASDVNIENPESSTEGAGSNLSERTGSCPSSGAHHPAPPLQNLHHPDGRFQFARFDGLDVLHTYVPNRSWKPEGVRKRREWDEELLGFLLARREMAPNVPFVWCGDLNVAHTPDDSTDEDFFRSLWGDSEFASREEYHRVTPQGDRGIPGFSDNERDRFGQILHSVGLFDAWRELHPSPIQAGAPPPHRSENAFTWRGTTRTPGRQQPARFEGKVCEGDTSPPLCCASPPLLCLRESITVVTSTLAWLALYRQACGSNPSLLRTMTSMRPLFPGAAA